MDAPSRTEYEWEIRASSNWSDFFLLPSLFGRQLLRLCLFVGLGVFTFVAISLQDLLDAAWKGIYGFLAMFGCLAFVHAVHFMHKKLLPARIKIKLSSTGVAIGDGAAVQRYSWADIKAISIEDATEGRKRKILIVEKKTSKPTFEKFPLSTDIEVDELREWLKNRPQNQ